MSTLVTSLHVVVTFVVYVSFLRGYYDAIQKEGDHVYLSFLRGYYDAIGRDHAYLSFLWGYYNVNWVKKEGDRICLWFLRGQEGPAAGQALPPTGQGSPTKTTTAGPQRGRVHPQRRPRPAGQVYPQRGRVQRRRGRRYPQRQRRRPGVTPLPPTGRFMKKPRRMKPMLRRESE